MAVPGIIRFAFTAASATATPREIIRLQLNRKAVRRPPDALEQGFDGSMQPSLQRLSIEDTLSQGPR